MTVEKDIRSLHKHVFNLSGDKMIPPANMQDESFGNENERDQNDIPQSPAISVSQTKVFRFTSLFIDKP